MRYLILLILCSYGITLHGQSEAANWYFGYNAGLTFNSGVPLPLNDGELFTSEGCATISTPAGNLLFYTDGSTVWDRNHNIMPNGEGLLGSESSTQSAMIVPKPNDTSTYYIFTADTVQNYEDTGVGVGINYSEVNMSANGGLGDVTVKNFNLLSEGSENISAVQTTDGIDYWVVTQSLNKFYSYKVNAGGVSTSPIVSTIGPNISYFRNFRGALKIAPNGSKIAIAHGLFFDDQTFEDDFQSQLMLYDFNRTTGAVSNAVNLSGDLLYYGVEFSANSKRLYATGKEIINGGNATDGIKIEQFDVNVADVEASRYTLASRSNFLQGNLSGSLQLGNDRKIYHSVPGIELSVINAPNNDDANADYRINAVPIGDGLARFGLPPFIQSYFETVVDITNVCFTDATQFTLDTSDAINGVQWNFGDPASGANNTSTLLNPTHVFTSTGTFTVTIDVDYAVRADRTYIEFVQIADIPALNSPVTLVQCDAFGPDDGISRFNLTESLEQLVSSSLGISTIFFESLVDAQNNENPIDSFDYQNTSNGQIVFARVFQNAECFAIGQVVLQVVPMSFIDDYFISVCNRDANPNGDVTLLLSDIEAIIELDFPGANFTFYNTVDDALLESNGLIDEFESNSGNGNPDLYFRVEYGNDCDVIGKFDLDLRESPMLENEQVFICPGDQEIELSVPPEFDSYLWSTGETTATIVVSAIGDYEVTVLNGANCDASKIFTVNVVPPPNNIEVEVNDFNSNNSITIIIDNEELYQYSLNDGFLQSEPYFDGLLPGVYTIQVWENGCLVYIRNVMVGGVPALLTPNNDGFHDTWQVLGLDAYPKSKIFIFDRYGKLLKEMGPFSEPWEGRYLGQLLPSSDYWYRIDVEDGRIIKGHFTMKR